MNAIKIFTLSLKQICISYCVTRRYLKTFDAKKTFFIVSHSVAALIILQHMYYYIRYEK